MLKLFACIVIGVILGDVIDSISNNRYSNIRDYVYCFKNK